MLPTSAVDLLERERPVPVLVQGEEGLLQRLDLGLVELRRDRGERQLLESGVTKLSISTPTSGDPLGPSKSCILKRFSTPYIKPFRRHRSV